MDTYDDVIKQQQDTVAVADAALKATPAPSEWKKYKQRDKLVNMREYVVGEDLSRVNIPATVLPDKGGMIACPEGSTSSFWYIPKDVFENEYVTQEVAEENPSPKTAGVNTSTSYDRDRK